MDFIERNGRIYKVILQDLEQPEINRLFHDNVSELRENPAIEEENRVAKMNIDYQIYEMLLPVGMKVVYTDDIFGFQDRIGFLDNRTPYPLIKETIEEEDHYISYNLEILSTPVEPMEFYEQMRLQNREYLSPYQPVMIMRNDGSYCIGLPHSDTYALPSIYLPDGKSLSYYIEEYIFDKNGMYVGRDPHDVLQQTSRPYPIQIYVSTGRTPEDDIYYPWKPQYEEAIYLQDVVVTGIVCFEQSYWSSLDELLSFLEPHRFTRKGPIYSISDVDIF